MLSAQFSDSVREDRQRTVIVQMELAVRMCLALADVILMLVIKCTLRCSCVQRRFPAARRLRQIPVSWSPNTQPRESVRR
jgi:hypothetical protein